MVDGKTKTFYLGTGKGKTDLDSYAKAWAKWDEIERKISQTEQVDRYAAYREYLMKQPGTDLSQFLPHRAPLIREGEQKGWEVREELRRTKAVPPAPQSTSPSTSTTTSRIRSGGTNTA